MIPFYPSKEKVCLCLLIIILIFLYPQLTSAQAPPVDTLEIEKENESSTPFFRNIEYEKGIRYVAKDSSYSIKPGVTFQSYADLSTSSNDLQDLNSRALIRRARLKFDGFAYDPSIIYKIELGLSNTDIGNLLPEGNNASNIVLDAVIKWRPFGNTTFWFGQAKLPGNRERVISSQFLQFVDRSNLNALYNIDRDMGIQVHNEFVISGMVFRHIYAISSGEGRNLTTNNNGGLDYTARLEFLPLGKFTQSGDYVCSEMECEEKPKIAIGASYDYNDDTSRERGQLGNFLDYTSDLQTLFLDVVFKYRGFSVLGEYADKKSSPRITSHTTRPLMGQFTSGTGFNVQGGYMFISNMEVAARYTETHPKNNTGLNSEYHYTLAFSRYIVRHNFKIQTDLSFIEEAKVNDDRLQLRFQLTFAL